MNKHKNNWKQSKSTCFNRINEIINSSMPSKFWKINYLKSRKNLSNSIIFWRIKIANSKQLSNKWPNLKKISNIRRKNKIACNNISSRFKWKSSPSKNSLPWKIKENRRAVDFLMKQVLLRTTSKKNINSQREKKNCNKCSWKAIGKIKIYKQESKNFKNKYKPEKNNTKSQLKHFTKHSLNFSNRRWTK